MIRTSACFLFLLGILVAPLGAADPTVAPQAGLLLLRNGRVLAGAVTRLGDRYLVDLGNQTAARVPESDVEFFCRDWERAYWFKQSVSQPGLSGRLELVDWCMRHDLLPQAADQLLVALAIDAKDPRVRRYQVRLQVAMQRQQPDPPPPPSQPTRPAAHLSGEDLDRLIRDLPEGTVEKFTNHVQPLFMNRCAAGQCHGGNEGGKLRLVRPVQGSLSRRFTQRNLHSALQFVDQQNPSQSALIKALSDAHGGAEHPALSSRDELQMSLVRDWIRSYAKGHSLARPSRIERPATILLQAASEPQAFEQASHQRPLPAEGSRSQTWNEYQVANSDEAAAPVARDPFDADVFNRRHHETRKPASIPTHLSLPSGPVESSPAVTAPDFPLPPDSRP